MTSVDFYHGSHLVTDPTHSRNHRCHITQALRVSKKNTCLTEAVVLVSFEAPCMISRTQFLTHNHPYTSCNANANNNGIHPTRDIALKVKGQRSYMPRCMMPQKNNTFMAAARVTTEITRNVDDNKGRKMMEHGLLVIHWASVG